LGGLLLIFYALWRLIVLVQDIYQPNPLLLLPENEKEAKNNDN
jgi:hypothetical protein